MTDFYTMQYLSNFGQAEPAPKKHHSEEIIAVSKSTEITRYGIEQIKRSAFRHVTIILSLPKDFGKPRLNVTCFIMSFRTPLFLRGEPACCRQGISNFNMEVFLKHLPDRVSRNLGIMTLEFIVWNLCL
jgi:hypothetical protein